MTTPRWSIEQSTPGCYHFAGEITLPHLESILRHWRCMQPSDPHLTCDFVQVGHYDSALLVLMVALQRHAQHQALTLKLPLSAQAFFSHMPLDAFPWTLSYPLMHHG